MKTHTDIFNDYLDKFFPGQESIPYTVRYSDRNGRTPPYHASQVNSPEAAND